MENVTHDRPLHDGGSIRSGWYMRFVGYLIDKPAVKLFQFVSGQRRPRLFPPFSHFLLSSPFYSRRSVTAGSVVVFFTFIYYTVT